LKYILIIAFSSAGHAFVIPTEIPLADSRAHKLVVTHCLGGWHVIPSPESQFSRHSGTCIILGR
jgi:hypothetical protein